MKALVNAAAVVLSILAVVLLAGCGTHRAVYRLKGSRLQISTDFSSATTPTVSSLHRDASAMAKALVDRGAVADAIELLEVELAARPFNRAALELLVALDRKVAERKRKSGALGVAGGHLGRASDWIAYVRKAELAREQIDMEWLDHLRGLAKEVMVAVETTQADIHRRDESTIRRAIRRARACYQSGRGFWNDDEDEFVDALLVLDDVKPKLAGVSAGTAKEFAEIWVTLWDELGDSDREKYRVKTHLRNSHRGR